MNHNYRCVHTGKCGKRVKLSKPIKDYIIKPVCPVCGANLYHTKDVKRRNNERNCTCDGLPWDGPHRAGSNVWCIEHSTGPTLRDYVERYGFNYVTDWECYQGMCNGWW